MDKCHVTLLFIACLILRHANGAPVPSSYPSGGCGSSGGYSATTGGYGAPTGGYGATTSGYGATSGGYGSNYEAGSNMQYSKQGGSNVNSEKISTRSTGSNVLSTSLASSQYGGSSGLGTDKTTVGYGGGGVTQTGYGTGVNYGSAATNYQSSSTTQHQMEASSDKQSAQVNDYALGGKNTYEKVTSSSTSSGDGEGGIAYSFGRFAIADVGGTGSHSLQGGLSTQSEKGYSESSIAGVSSQLNKQSSYVSSNSYSQQNQGGQTVQAGVTESTSVCKSGSGGGTQGGY